MKILMTNHALHARGGSESYLEVVAAELRALEHEVHVFSPQCGMVAERLKGLGFPVHERPEDIPRDIDVIHGQHSDAVGLVRSALPTTPLVFITHSWYIPIEDPLTSLGIGAFVALNDLTYDRLLAHRATENLPIYRLTQPVHVSTGDLERTALPEVPQKAVAVSRSLSKVTIELKQACKDLGIDFTVVGSADSESDDARVEMMSADIVFAIGRTALEAMAAARSVFILSETNRSGWVTSKTYQSLERDGFTGLKSPEDGRPILESLHEYNSSFGVEARKFVLRNHVAQQHASSLVEIYKSTIPVPAQHIEFDSLGNLALRAWALEGALVQSEWRRAELLRVHEIMLSSRSWKLTQPFRGLLRWIRAPRQR